MKQSVKPLDVVALLDDLPLQGLVRGQVGTVVELLPGGALEVEFTDEQGRSYAETAIQPQQLIVLRYRPGTVD